MQKIIGKVLTSAALAVTLSACSGDMSADRKANAPIPGSTMKLMDDKGMKPSDPVMMRIVKADSKLEVWKKASSTGKYGLLKTYDICRWSGDLGPKVNEGDRQAPEGFYTITPAQMNPASNYYLSFNTGFPNAYDRAYGRSGSHLMVHGDCSSRGCYAMTDVQIAEIYAIARESFRGGQKSFQLQALPFQMNAKNMFTYRNSPHHAFWQNLKEGTDQFEVTGLTPKVDVCSKKYVFNAEPKSPEASFEASSPCPAYGLPKDVEVALNELKAKEHEELQSLMNEDLHKKQGPKLAGLLGIGSAQANTLDPVIAAKSISKESAKPYLPSSSPEAVSLLALSHQNLPEDVVATSAPVKANVASKAPIKVAAVTKPVPAREIRGITDDASNEKLALLSGDTVITGSFGSFTKGRE